MCRMKIKLLMTYLPLLAALSQSPPLESEDDPQSVSAFGRLDEETRGCVCVFINISSSLSTRTLPPTVDLGRKDPSSPVAS